MGMLQLIATVAALAGLVLALTQLLKVHLGRKNAKGERESLKGRRVVVLSVLIGAGLGALLAAGGLADLADLVAFPPAGSGAVLGLLAGLVASGGKDAITGIQINGAKAQAKARAKYAPTPPGLPDDEWVDATLDELARG